MNMEDQIKAIRKKTEAAYQTILLIAGNKEFKGLEMESIWKLLEVCLLPIITYGSELWDLPKRQRDQIDKIYEDIIRRILKTPPTTPLEALYMETGLVDIGTISLKKRISMKGRLKDCSSELIQKVTETEIKGN